MSEKTTKVRVIAPQGEHKVDQVLALPAAEAKEAVAAGWADDDPAAVKYAEDHGGAPAPEPEPAGE